MSLGKPRTLKNLTKAIACESRVYLRHQHLAKIAAVAGHEDVSQALRLAVASGIERTHSVLDFLWQIDRPPCDVASAAMGREPYAMLHRNIAQSERRYREIARTAREERFDEIGQWFEMAATVEHSRLELFRRLLARSD